MSNYESIKTLTDPLALTKLNELALVIEKLQTHITQLEDRLNFVCTPMVGHLNAIKEKEEPQPSPESPLTASLNSKIKTLEDSNHRISYLISSLEV